MRTRVAGWVREDNYGRLWAGVVFFVVLVLLTCLIPLQGLTDDDDFYAPAGIQYADWLTEAVANPAQAWKQNRIDRVFRINKEHPPFAKYVIGISHRILTKTGILHGLDAARFGVAFFAALLCAVMLRLLWRPMGPLAAFFAVAALLSLPRFVFHSQVATLDVPVASMVFLTTAVFFWGQSSRFWAWTTGVVFGFALLTKLNAPFAVFPIVIFSCIASRRRFGLFRKTKRSISLAIPSIPRSLIAMALLGPLVFFAFWPWLWSDTFKRLGSYLAFHLKHYPIYLFYNGEIYTEPFAPWTMPFTMAAAVIPMPLFFLGLLGICIAVRSLLRYWRAEKSVITARQISPQERLLSLIFLEALFAISIVAFSNVPKYGGEKLFMPFFPLFAVLMAAGFLEVRKAISIVMSSKLPLAKGHVVSGAVILGAVLAILPGQIANLKYSGGFALSYYSSMVGGLKGATARGYERTYYDIADKELAVWLSDNVGNDSVHFEPNHKEYVRTYRWLKKDGYIPRGLRLEKSKSRAKVVVLTHERRWKTYPRLLANMGSWEQIYEKRIDDVPLYTVYRKR